MGRKNAFRLGLLRQNSERKASRRWVGMSQLSKQFVPDLRSLSCILHHTCLYTEDPDFPPLKTRRYEDAERYIYSDKVYKATQRSIQSVRIEIANLGALKKAGGIRHVVRDSSNR